MKLFLTIALPLFLSGCVGLSVPSNKVFDLGLSSSSNKTIEMVDARQENSKHYHRNNNGGLTIYLGDENFQPGRMEGLRNQLGSKLVSSNMREPVVIEAFDVYLIDMSGNLGSAPMLTGFAGSVPLSVLNGSTLNNLTSREAPIVGCNLTVKHKNQQFNKNIFINYPLSQIEKGMTAVVVEAASQVAEMINSNN